ncbi:MAG TPA: ABC transporter ATP-binding protein [Clostridiales bacterium]|jgi:ABC-2 type transport system ATP-binding protein|nr:ABC transporter ATP-binding protein [Clostridiales bacterium]
MGMVTVKNLKKVYGDFTAVDGISFDIQEGEIFGFLGPNGAGKTSTINMLIGLSRPTGGMISINGIDGIKDIKKAQSIMGIVPDESNLYDEMDGFHNLCFCASLYGMGKKEREKRAYELLEQFSLKDAGNRPFKAYSKGMRRKLTIAAGIIHNPKILFLDEPTTGIDVESARQIRSLILDMKERGTTVFLTTHYIEEAERICDRIAFIVNGKIVKTGTVNQLMENAGQEHIIRLTLDDGASGIKNELQDNFPNYIIEVKDENTCFIKSPVKFALSPILQYLDGRGISVFEAKEIRPTLEDVFVKVTGIEARELQKDKEGGRK